MRSRATMGRPRNNNNNKPSQPNNHGGGGGGGGGDDGEAKSKARRPSMKEETKALEAYLNMLFEKKGSTREAALSSIIDILNNNVHSTFVINKCITLLHRCLNSIKQGSAREIYLASHVIGLLSITVGCVDALAYEILEDSFLLLSQSLQSTSEPLKIAPLLDCLAIITFVGGNDVEETERSMQVMWQFIHLTGDPRVVASEPNSQVLTAAISGWSFLLATVESWSISSKLWMESMSCLSNLLYNDDLSIRMTVGEALALIFEIGNLAKFSNESKISSDESKIPSASSTDEESDGHVSKEKLKDKILNQLRNLSMERGDDDLTEKSLIKSYRALFHDILRVLKGCYCPETRINIGGDMLKISTWSQLVQVNYLKRLLGDGFVKHARENVLLRDFLEFTPKSNRQLQGGKQHISSDEKVPIHYVFQPKLDRLSQKSMTLPVLDKAKTQMMNSKRMLSQTDSAGTLSATDGDEASRFPKPTGKDGLVV